MEHGKHIKTRTHQTMKKAMKPVKMMMGEAKKVAKKVRKESGKK